jgi:hypothetical protein
MTEDNFKILLRLILESETLSSWDMVDCVLELCKEFDEGKKKSSNIIQNLNVCKK